MGTENRRSYYPLFFSLILIVGVLLGYFLGGKNAGKRSVFKQSKNGKVDDIMYYLENRYFDSINADQLLDKAIDKMFDQLDPHSTYIPRKDLPRVEESLSGQLEGIGVQFNILNDTIQVINTIVDGPAEKAGMRAGDKIVEIDGESSVGFSDEQVLGSLKGKRGSKVRVGVVRAGLDSLMEFPIVRDVIAIKSVDPYFMVDDTRAYIRMTTFGRKTYEEFMKAMRELKSQGMQSLILDLQGNRGGLLEIATDIADEFLPGKKVIVSMKRSLGNETSYKSRRKGIFEEGELKVLIDGGSASASEILAGALKHYNRAEVIGRRSYGKGTVQEQYGLNDGSAMRLTIAKYFLPDGRSIDLQLMRGDLSDEEILQLSFKPQLPDSISWGVEPDVFVEIDTSDFGKQEMLLARTQVARLFAYNYYPRNRNEFKVYNDFTAFDEDFKVSEEMLGRFWGYAEKSGMEMKTLDKDKLRTYVETSITAHLAKQHFGEEAQTKILNRLDKAYQAAIR